MSRLGDALFSALKVSRRAAAARLSGLPPYQVALWPDGWELGRDGAVRVRDTHAMAEARRWYDLAERNHSAAHEARRVMAMHGVFVPRVIVDLAERRFPSEEVASVAVQLIAGDWVKQRRRRLLADPELALAERAGTWSGSRHRPMSAEGLAELVRGLLDSCIAERLIADALYRIEVREEDGYGIRGLRCCIVCGLDRYARARLQEALTVALIPWNRAVARHGVAVPVARIQVRAAPAVQGGAAKPRGGVEPCVPAPGS